MSIAAKVAGCRSIGVELNEAYCEIAARRLAQEVLPFDDRGSGDIPVPVRRASRSRKPDLDERRMGHGSVSTPTAFTQPGPHTRPNECPTYYDGCNCDD